MRFLRGWLPAIIASVAVVAGPALAAPPVPARSPGGPAPSAPATLAPGIPGPLAQGIPPSVPNAPALGVGLRLEHEAFAAQQYAILLQSVGNQVQADDQNRVARNRSNQAVHEFAAVQSSATFGNTPAAGEALYQSAVVSLNILKDKFGALATLRTLRNNYGPVNYPDKAAAMALLAVVWPQVDHYYRTTGFWPIGYKLMLFLVNLTGAKSYSYWLAILMISLIVKLILYPVNQKQYASMREMQKLQPLVSEIQTKHKDDPQKLQEKTWALYKEHNVNPFSTCSSVIWTIPIMYGLWSLIRLFEFQFSKGTFLWIGSPISHIYPNILATDLSQPDTILLLIYAGSMYFQMRMTPAPADPAQAEQQKMMAIYMPAFYAFFFLKAKLSSAFVLYYLIFNLLSMAQQASIMKKRAAEGPVVPLQPKADPPSEKREAAGRVSRNGSSETSAHDDDAGGIGTANGVKPASRGAIAPKVHPKKKRR
jgi:YidC/Oxa1 family membrane protein insertase